MNDRTPGGRRLSRTLVAACVALAAASGCAVGPRWHPPSAPAAAGYAPRALPQLSAAAPVHGGEAQHFALGRDVPAAWWRLFGSPALDALIAQAFNANPSIASAQAALRQAQELVAAQRGYFFPTLDASYQFERQQLPGNLVGTSAPGFQGNGTNLSAVQSPLPPYNEPLIYGFHTAQITVGYVPDVFGANRRQVESLSAQAEVARYELEATYLTLAANVVAAAIQEAEVRAEISAVERIVADEEQSLRILRNQFRLGYAMRLDVAAQQTSLAQARAWLPPLRKQLGQTRDLLRALAGRLPNEPLPATFALDALTLPSEIPLSVPARLVRQRPDIRAAEAQLHAANAQVGVALAAMLPQFSISAADGGAASAFDWMFRHGGPFWDLIGSVSQPVFHGGTLLHQKRAAERALQEAAAQYRTTVIAAYQNVADSLHAALADADALAADVQAEKAAKVTLDLTRKQMEVGYVSDLTLLGAEAAYSEAVLTRVQAEATRYGDTVALFQALGGGGWNGATRLDHPEGAGATH